MMQLGYMWGYIERSKISDSQAGSTKVGLLAQVSTYLGRQLKS